MKNLFIFISCLFLFSSCKKDKDDNNVTPVTTTPITQFADAVIGFSSEYTTASWSASQVLGKPNVYPLYEDNSSAWAPATRDGQREHLVVAFDTLQTISKVEIYETWVPGAIDTLYVRNASTKQWNQIWAGTAQAAPTVARIFAVDIPETNYKVDAVRIAINSPIVSGWNEIDAIAITGKR